MRKLILIGIFLSLSVVYATPPQPLSASYDQSTHRLTINFSEPIANDSASIQIGMLRIDDDFGGRNPDVRFNGVGYVAQPNDSSITFDLVYSTSIDSYTYTGSTGLPVTALCWGKQTAGLQAFEKLANRDQLRVHINSGFVRSTTNEWNSATSDSGLVLSFNADFIPLQLLSATFRAETNELALSYNRPVKFDVIAEDRMMPDEQGVYRLPGNRILDVGEDRNNNGVLDIEPNFQISNISISSTNGSVALSGGDVVTLHDTSTLVLKLTIPNRRSVKALNHDSLKISYPAFAVVDTSYRTGSPIRTALTYIPESDTLRLDSSTYDWGLNKLKLYFNIPLETSTTDILYGRIAIGGSDSLWALSGGNPILSEDNLSLEIGLSTGDQMKVEDFARRYPPTRLSLSGGAVLSSNGNDNQPATVNVSNILETPTNHGPVPLSASYNAVSNRLSVTFDQRISDRASKNDVVVTGFGIASGSTERYLTGGTYTRSGGNLTVNVTLTDSDEVRIENLRDKSALKLRMLPFSVLQLSILNGNVAIGGDSIGVTYIADTTALLLSDVFVDRVKGTAKFSFNKAVELFNNNLPSSIVIAGVTFDSIGLDTTGRIDTTLSKSITLKMSVSNTASIQNVTGSDLLNPGVSVLSPVFCNLDSSPNPTWTDLHSGDTVRLGTVYTTLIAGIGRTFWVKSLERFPTPDRVVSAILRKSGVNILTDVSNNQHPDTTDLYIETTLFRPFAKNNNKVPMKQKMIDSLWSFYAQHSITDTNVSAVQKLASFVAPHLMSLLPTHTAILWTDLLDEFNLGRNDTKTDYFIGSLFNPTDQLRPEETTANTNNIDMVYLDGWPQTVTATDTSFYIVTTTTPPTLHSYTTPGQTAYYGLANAIAQLFLYKVDKYEQPWEVEGLSQMAEEVTTGKSNFFGAGTPGIPANNNVRSLTLLGNGLSTRDDFFNINFFFNYLHEQYDSNFVFFSRLAESRLTGIAAIETTLVQSQDIIPVQNRNRSLADLYLDFSTACLLDTTNGHDLNRYQIRAASLWGSMISKNGNALKWKSDPVQDRPPYNLQMNAWSYAFGVIYWDSDTSTHENPLLNVATDSLIINTIDSLGFRARAVWLSNGLLAPGTNPDFEVKDFNFDQYGIGAVPVSTTINNRSLVPGSGNGQMRMLVIVEAKTDSRLPFAQGDFLLTNHSGPPEYTGFSVEADPASDRYIGLWVSCSQQLYNSLGIEAPEIVMTHLTDNSTTIVPLSRKFTTGTDMSFTYLYNARTFLASPGLISFALRAISANGKTIVSPVDTMQVMTVPSGGSIRWNNGSVLAAKSTPLGFTWVMPERPETDVTVKANSKAPVFPSPVVHIGPDRLVSDPVLLTLSIPEALRGQAVAIYRQDNGEWRRIGGEHDNTTIRARVSKLGRFTVMSTSVLAKNADDASLPLRYEVGNGYPNPFNGAVSLPIALPERSNVKLVIYNVLGRTVATMNYNQLSAGRHIISWHGEVPSGIYFARLTAGSTERTLKLVRVQ